jgi:hypothetical protein
MGGLVGEGEMKSGGCTGTRRHAGAKGDDCNDLHEAGSVAVGDRFWIR